MMILTITLSHGILVSFSVDGGGSHDFGALNNIYLGSVACAVSTGTI